MWLLTDEGYYEALTSYTSQDLPGFILKYKIVSMSESAEKNLNLDTSFSDLLTEIVLSLKSVIYQVNYTGMVSYLLHATLKWLQWQLVCQKPTQSVI